MEREEALQIIKNHCHLSKDLEDACAYFLPEIKECVDERIKKALIDFFSKGAENNAMTNGVADKDILAWLEKQGEEKHSVIPSRETILNIWDLGNEWKELTKGSISTEHGTQLEFIQKHWGEGSYI